MKKEDRCLLFCCSSSLVTIVLKLLPTLRLEGLKSPLIIKKYGRLPKFSCGHMRLGDQGDRERPFENDNQYLKILVKQNPRQSVRKMPQNLLW